MKLFDILRRVQPPVPWQEGDNIPWHDLAFSVRMLAEHLTQTHDRASRRAHLIDQHVAWIHETLLSSRPARILDLGCGPGLYSNRLAALGHHCHGIDYSPASIAYAHDRAIADNLTATYLHEDMRAAAFGDDYDLAMLLFGEVNVFSKQDITHILTKAYIALAPGGLLLLEAHTYASLIPAPGTTHSWFSSEGGLFAPTPHLVLIEQHWDEARAITTTRYYIINAAATTDTGPGAEVTRYAQSMQAYSVDDYIQLLNGCGFSHVVFLPGLAHDRLAPPPEFQAILARKPEEK